MLRQVKLTDVGASRPPVEFGLFHNGSTKKVNSGRREASWKAVTEMNGTGR